MKMVDETIVALGRPMFLHHMGIGRSPDAVVARWRHGDAEIKTAASDVVRVTISLQPGQHVRHRGRGASAIRDVQVGSAMVTPACTPTQVMVEGQSDILQVFLGASFVESAVGVCFECLPLFDSHDRELQAAAMQLLVAAARGDPDDPLLLEAGIHQIAAHLLDCSRGEPSGPKRGGLAVAAYRRVEELVAASLRDTVSTSPTLAEMAAVADLSVNHFVRVFRQHVGETPHRYVVRRRLERAIELLGMPGTSVGEVAENSGFATPAHFVASFRRTMGVTPGAVRAALLS